MLSANRVPANQVPLNNPNTGLVSREWFRFFANLNTIVSTVYTPTLTNTTNVASSAASECQYLRVYSVATISGQVTIAAAATGSTVLKMSLPLASKFVSTGQAAGTFASTTLGSTTTGAILADIVNGVLEFRFNAANTTSTVYAFTVTYQVV